MVPLGRKYNGQTSRDNQSHSRWFSDRVAKLNGRPPFHALDVALRQSQLAGNEELQPTAHARTHARDWRGARLARRPIDDLHVEAQLVRPRSRHNLGNRVAGHLAHLGLARSHDGHEDGANKQHCRAHNWEKSRECIFCLCLALSA